MVSSTAAAVAERLGASRLGTLVAAAALFWSAQAYAQQPAEQGRNPGLLEGASSALQILFDMRGQPPSPPAGSPPIEPLERTPEGYRIPLAGAAVPDDVRIENQNGRITLVARDAALRDLLMMLARSQGVNIVFADNVDGRITLMLENQPFDVVLDSILALTGYTWAEHRGIIHVTRLATEQSLRPDLQNRHVEVFPLNFVAAADVDLAIKQMLSPVGNSYVLESSKEDHRRTMDTIVVEDLPVYLDRIRNYVAIIDQAPRQVMIEAHILEVDLEDDGRHGVDWTHIFNISGHGVTLETRGFTNEGASQAFFARLSPGDLTAVLECLKSTTDAKTLASPKLLVVNGQSAKIQIGERLPYVVTTTTQTVSTETVNFLDVGVVLQVTPRISHDRRVLMNVKPEISSGRINEVGLPQEETTEVATDVLLFDNQGIVIGGLIKQTDHRTAIKLPFFGDLKYVGPLFQRRQDRRSRSEIVIALIPRVLPYACDVQEREDFELMRTQTPLLFGPLERYPRPFEPSLPDAIDNPRVMRLPPVPPEPVPIAIESIAP